MNSIDRISAQSISRAYVQQTDAGQSAGAQAAAKSQQAPQAARADSVSLSDDARALASARDAVQKTPDVREEKVAEIKQRIEDGTYSVSASVLARKMIDTANGSNPI